MSSRPLLSRSGCIFGPIYNRYFNQKFSSPFIEERLYFQQTLLKYEKDSTFSSPFIEERLYFKSLDASNEFKLVLVPFYRGAVVFDGMD